MSPVKAPGGGQSAQMFSNLKPGGIFLTSSGGINPIVGLPTAGSAGSSGTPSSGLKEAPAASSIMAATLKIFSGSALNDDAASIKAPGCKLIA